MLPCIAFAGPPEPAFFFFCLSFARPLSPAWRGWLSLIQVRRCPGFARNWVTRLQQGWSRALAVSFPYLALKIAHRPSQGRVCFFSPERAYPSPFRGGGVLIPTWVCGFAWLRPQLAHAGPTGWVWWFAGVASLPGPQTGRKSAHRGEFGIQRFLRECFGSGRAESSCSNLRSTASWMGRIV